MNNDEVWRTWYPGLMTLVRGFRQFSREEQEDIVQEIMLKCWKKYHRFDDRYAFSTWLYRIARNHCIDALRKKERRAGREMRLIEESCRSSYPEPPAAMAEAEDIRQARQFLDSLEERDRSIAFLLCHEGLKIRDVAAVLDMPEGTVKYRMHRIRETAKAELKGVRG
jgi:RNA polymerase sigma factor (sigma-70 family)